jgi:hypothetical protein
VGLLLGNRKDFLLENDMLHLQGTVVNGAGTRENHAADSRSVHHDSEAEELGALMTKT